MQDEKVKGKVYLVSLIIVMILGIYVLMSIYFDKHYYFGTYINGINVSCKTVDEANDLLLKESYNYVIKLEERDNITESIEGSNINFKYEGSNEAQEIKDRQNPALWLINILLIENYY